MLFLVIVIIIAVIISKYLYKYIKWSFSGFSKKDITLLLSGSVVFGLIFLPSWLALQANLITILLPIVFGYIIKNMYTMNSKITKNITDNTIKANLNSHGKVKQDSITLYLVVYYISLILVGYFYKSKYYNILFDYLLPKALFSYLIKTIFIIWLLLFIFTFFMFIITILTKQFDKVEDFEEIKK